MISKSQEHIMPEWTMNMKTQPETVQIGHRVKTCPGDLHNSVAK